MSVQIPRRSYTGQIREISIGAGDGLVVGGASAFPPKLRGAPLPA